MTDTDPETAGIYRQLLMTKTPAEVCSHLKATGMPNLWIPDPASFVEVEDIPVLGTGKLDLKGVSDLAKQHFAA